MLAELVEGVLADAQSERIQYHVDQCRTCQSVVTQLHGVTAALRDLPDQITIPEHLAAQVSAALATEQVSRRSMRAGSQERSEGTVAWFRRRVPQVLAAAASVGIIGFAGYVVTSGNGGSGDGVSVAGAGISAEKSSSRAALGAEDQTMKDVAPNMLPGQQRQVDRGELVAVMTSVWEQRSELTAGCGRSLAEERGQRLIGSTAADTAVLGSNPAQEAVLVVLEDDKQEQLSGWLIPTCNSLTSEALTAALVIPVP
jgi:DNA-binding FrmR family transcriptional regulator